MACVCVWRLILRLCLQGISGECVVGWGEGRQPRIIKIRLKPIHELGKVNKKDLLSLFIRSRVALKKALKEMRSAWDVMTFCVARLIGFHVALIECGARLERNFLCSANDAKDLITWKCCLPALLFISNRSDAQSSGVLPTLGEKVEKQKQKQA